LPAEFLADQAFHSVGESHASYNFRGHQWALAIDAATPVSARRPDLLEKLEVEIPESWDGLLDLARRGMVALPAIPVDSLMNFYMLCGGLGEDPFVDESRVVSEEIGVEALERLRELIGLCEPECLRRNPIATYEAMAARDDLLYCPFAYGYSNYARPGYARNVLHFGGLVSFGSGAAERRLRSTLGGTGLAISRRCQQVELAVEYASLVASPECQRRLYFTSGGQPGHRAAWEDAEVNSATNDFFADTLQTLDEAYLRPRYDGYLHFQDEAGTIVHRYLMEGGAARSALSTLETIYRRSRQSR
jgi:multiple sugar transport system substrate-binding protein